MYFNLSLPSDNSHIPLLKGDIELPLGKMMTVHEWDITPVGRGGGKLVVVTLEDACISHVPWQHMGQVGAMGSYGTQAVGK